MMLALVFAVSSVAVVQIDRRLRIVAALLVLCALIVACVDQVAP